MYHTFTSEYWKNAHNFGDLRAIWRKAIQETNEENTHIFLRNFAKNYINIFQTVRFVNNHKLLKKLIRKVTSLWGISTNIKARKKKCWALIFRLQKNVHKFEDLRTISQKEIQKKSEENTRIVAQISFNP